MKRCVKYLTLVLLLAIFAFALTGSVSAEAAEEGAEESLYRAQYESSGAAELEEHLPRQTRDLLDSFGLDPSDPKQAGGLEIQNIFTVIWEFLSSGMTGPITSVMAVIGVLLIFAATDGLMAEPPGTALSVFVCFLAALTQLHPVYSLIGSLQEAMQNISAFMLAFVPVYAGMLVSAGSAGMAGGFSALLLGAAEGISQFLSYAFLPVVGACMCLGICGGISPIPGIARLAEWIKKSAVWVMGIVTTVFLGVLSLQTSVTAAADNVGIRTSKAVIAGSIPVMGPAIAETLNTARGCLTLLRSGVGIYGVVAVALIALPLLLELLCWRVGMWLCTGVAELFGMVQVTALFKTLDFCLAIFVGAVSFTALLFIISMTVVMKVGG